MPRRWGATRHYCLGVQCTRYGRSPGVPMCISRSPLLPRPWCLVTLPLALMLAPLPPALHHTITPSLADDKGWAGTMRGGGGDAEIVFVGGPSGLASFSPGTLPPLAIPPPQGGGTVTWPKKHSKH